MYSAQSVQSMSLVHYVQKLSDQTASRCFEHLQIEVIGSGGCYFRVSGYSLVASQSEASMCPRAIVTR